MTPEAFRRIALAFPDALESAHMGHPDFRVGGRIFATIDWPSPGWGVVNLTPHEQELFVQADAAAFEAVPGGWGRRGSTRVRLEAADEATLRSALTAAWRKTAPKKLVRQFDEGHATGG